MDMEPITNSIALLLIEKYGEYASTVAAERARVLEGCNDRQIALSWDLVCRRIEQIAPFMPKDASRDMLDPFEPMPVRSRGFDLDDDVQDEDELELVT